MPGPRGVWWRSHWFRRAPTASRQPQDAGWAAGCYGIGSIATTREVLRGLPALWRDPLLDAARKAALAALVRAGPGPETHGVVGWRRVGLQREIERRFGVTMQERTAGRQFAALGFRRLSVRPPEIRPAGPGGVWKLCRQGTGRPARCGARQENRGVAPAQSACRPAGRRAIPDANGPVSLAPAVCPERAETAAPVMPYANTAAMTSPKSRRPSLKAPTPSWRRTGRAGTAQGRCAFPITSRSCRCRPTLHRSTLSKTSGPACAPTRPPSPSSTHTTISSTVAAKLGTSSPTIPPPSVQSQHAIMQIGSTSRNSGIKRDIHTGLLHRYGS